MNKQNKIKTFFLYSIFICYVILLIKILLLSRISIWELSDIKDLFYYERSINLIPFYSIRGYIFSTDMEVKRFAFSNIVGNIVLFIPLGTYLILFKKNKKIINNLLSIFIISFFVEIIQWVFNIGALDIDDIILNCFGGLIGILGYKFLLCILRDEKKVYTVITIISIIGLPIILYLLFMIKLSL